MDDYLGIEPVAVTFDGTDVMVAVLVWMLTLVTVDQSRSHALVVPSMAYVRHAAPLVAALTATALRMAYAFGAGTVVATDLLVRGFAVGAIVVLFHSQAREVAKVIQQRGGKPPKP